MSFPDAERLELDALCSALIDGSAGDSQGARLEEMLALSEEARRYYVRAMALSSSLFDYAGEMQMEAPSELPGPAENERPARTIRWTVASLAAAAIVLLAWWLGGAMAFRNDGESRGRRSGER
jgi:ferric-dicitrate binding protein FerR (iron transport regulator)